MCPWILRFRLRLVSCHPVLRRSWRSTSYPTTPPGTAHILNAIFSALLNRESPYAMVIAALLDLTGHKAQAVTLAVEQSLDESWSEPEAFDGCSTRGQARPSEPQPINFVRKTSTQTRGVIA